MDIPIQARCGNNIVTRKFKKLVFKPIGEEWPSMYFHDEPKLLLVIYVDDLKLAGPPKIWPKVGKCCALFCALNPKPTWDFT